MQSNSWIKVTVVAVIIISAAAGAGAWYYSTRSEGPNYEFIRAERTDLLQLVSVTGNVQPVEEVNLAFEVTGRVSMVLADVGDHVNQGDALIKLVNNDLTSQLARSIADLENERARLVQLQAALAVEESALAELQRGTREEEIRVARTRLDNAVQAKADAELDLEAAAEIAREELNAQYDAAEDDIQNAYTIIDDALKIKTDDFFSDSFVNSGDLVFTVEDAAIESEARNSRRASLDILNRLKNDVNRFPLSNEELEALLLRVEADLGVVQGFLFTLAQALVHEIDLHDSQKAAFQSNLDFARQGVGQIKGKVSSRSQQITLQKALNKNAINTAQTALNSASNAVTLAQSELDLALSGALPENLASQEARIEQAKANITSQEARIRAAQSQVSITQSQLEKTVLRTPISGVITKQEAKVGEVVALTEAFSSDVVSIISDAAFEIIANVPEVDIAKLKLGDRAEVTLDAYGGDEVFEATVEEIDPAETIIEGVPTYKVTMLFTQEDARIRPGMTANIDVMTASIEDVIAVPQRTVQFERGQNHVRVVDENGEIIRRPVTTGLTSWDGLIEIRSGLEEGERVITFIES